MDGWWTTSLLLNLDTERKLGRRGGRAHTKMETRGRWKWDAKVDRRDFRSLRRSIFWVIAFAGLGNGFRWRKGQWGTEWEVGGGMGTSTVLEKCVFEEETRQGGQSRFQHGSVWENELAPERGKSAQFRRQRKAGQDWVVYRKRTPGEMRVKWRTMKFTTTAEKNVERVSNQRPWLGLLTTATFLLWKRYAHFWDGGLRLGGERGAFGVWGLIQWMFPDGNTSAAFITEEWSGTFFLSKWAAEEHDWVQKLMLHPPKKDDVILCLWGDNETAHEVLMKHTDRHTHQKKLGIGPFGSWCFTRGQGGSSWKSGATRGR